MIALESTQQRRVVVLVVLGLVGALAACGPPPPPILGASPPQRLMEVLDRDGQAGLSEMEFTAAAIPGLDFSEFDTTGDGILDADEVRALLWKASPVIKPPPFSRDPRQHKPIAGMLMFRGDQGAACQLFRRFVEDACYHIGLVGGVVGDIPARLTKAIDARECSLRDARSKALLLDLAGAWRGAGMLDIFRDMELD